MYNRILVLCNFYFIPDVSVHGTNANTYALQMRLIFISKYDFCTKPQFTNKDYTKRDVL